MYVHILINLLANVIKLQLCTLKFLVDDGTHNIKINNYTYKCFCCVLFKVEKLMFILKLVRRSGYFQVVFVL